MDSTFGLRWDRGEDISSGERDRGEGVHRGIRSVYDRARRARGSYSSGRMKFKAKCQLELNY